MGNMLTLDLGGVVEVNPVHVTGCRGCLRLSANDIPAPGSRHERYAYQGTTPRLDHVTTVLQTSPSPTGIDHPLVYDAAGNETHYYADRTYSARNLMTSIIDPSSESLTPHTIAYAHDGRGIRVKRTESPTANGTATRRFFYSPELHLLTTTNDDQPNLWGSGWIKPNSLADSRSDIIWFGSTPIAQINSGGTRRYTLVDHLGTPILQTDANATIIWQAEYEPYGDLWTLRTGTSRFDQPLRFPGQELAMTWEGHEENFNIFRWYGAGLARYSQPDPVGPGGSLNTYGYVDDDPIDSIDPLGLERHCTHFSRVNYIGIGAIRHHWPFQPRGNPSPRIRNLFNLIIFDARCSDCREKIDTRTTSLEFPPVYSGAAPVVQFTNVLSWDAVEFDVSVSTTWVVTSWRSTFDALARSMTLCYDCNR
jgi:RHS repeat-associated protein